MSGLKTKLYRITRNISKRKTVKRLTALSCAVLLSSLTIMSSIPQTVKGADITAGMSATTTIGQMLYGLFSASGATPVLAPDFSTKDALFGKQAQIGTLIENGMIKSSDGTIYNSYDDFISQTTENKTKALLDGVTDWIQSAADSGQSDFAKDYVVPIAQTEDKLSTGGSSGGPTPTPGGGLSTKFHGLKKRLGIILASGVIGTSSILPSAIGSATGSYIGQSLNNVLQEWAAPQIEYGIPPEMCNGSVVNALNSMRDYASSLGYNNYCASIYNSSIDFDSIFTKNSAVFKDTGGRYYLYSSSPNSMIRVTNSGNLTHFSHDFSVHDNYYWFWSVKSDRGSFGHNITGDYNPAFNFYNYTPNIVNNLGNAHDKNTIRPVINNNQSYSYPTIENINNYNNNYHQITNNNQNYNNPTIQQQVIENYNNFTDGLIQDYTEPTDPDKPTEPTEPTDPDKPTEPTEPTDPDKPTEPTEPTDPDKPTEPTEPTDPDKPTEPTEPTDPDKPTEPTEPTDPDKPTEPTEPTDPDEHPEYLFPNLKDYFPFCIPWDIYALFKKFDGTPEAPVIRFPIKSELYNIDEEIVLDLNNYNEQAKLLRFLETLLFIMSLLVATKKLIFS